MPRGLVDADAHCVSGLGQKITYESLGGEGVRTTLSHAGGPVALACEQRLLGGMIDQPRCPCVTADSHSAFL